MAEIIPLGIFIIASIVICIFDIKTMHIPLFVLYAAFGICLVLVAVFDFPSFYRRIFASLCLFALFFAVRLITRKKLGWGDVHYSLFCAFMTDIPACFFSVLISCALGAVSFLVLRLVKKSSSHPLNSSVSTSSPRKIPFTPFMFLGSIFALFF